MHPLPVGESRKPGWGQQTTRRATKRSHPFTYTIVATLYVYLPRISFGACCYAMLIPALTSLAESQTAPSFDKERHFFMLICLAFVIEHASASPRCGLREPKHVSVEILNVELLHAVEGIVQVAYNFTLRLQSSSERFQIVDLEIQHGTAADVGGIRKGGGCSRAGSFAPAT